MKRLGLLIISIIVTLVMIQAIFSGALMIKKEDKEIVLSKSILKAMEIKNVNKIQEIIDKQKEEEIEKLQESNQKKEEKKLEQEKDVDFASFYENTVFMGDSITEGLGAYNIISKYNVIAKKGSTVKDALQEVSKVKDLQPKNIVLLYGMNDIILFDNSQEYKAKYIEFINSLKGSLPDAKIYIVSPTPIMDKAKSTSEKLTNANVLDYRQKAKAVSDTTGVTYIDISPLLDGQDELHEGDGIHFKYDFYTIYLNKVKNIIESR